ncbi:hypothetical protein ABFS82_12G117900 [Erythranthe guttata]|uniref:Uncharacterized protein n=1 Tax=Erythranthe guttata TaxID=4155 RepID=A0A022QTK3_ERYGU|nr:PREDICTED: uncharacterized protein LOC105964827 [Erythranthe guttata]EYU31251.1 hypothetical protein MIMGU_mgv1a011075mg [Erythranthe guttata]|eukprot:XP_012844785.1 PREDICTED: uncharacterized protein LOC105964827 [Erythranthe guttata]
MQTINLEEKQLSPDDNLFSEIKTSRDFYTHLKIGDGDADVEEEEIEADDGDEDEEEEEEEFSFMCGGVITSPIAAEDAFVDGQIKSVFPLFNRDLLFHGEYSGEGLHENLPMRPPVKKVFVETGGGEGRAVAASSSSENDEVSASGPYCEWSERKAVEASPEVCKKSNSTGFSKIWRFKDLLGRSNSDGRDAFVFLNNGHAPPSAEEHQAPAAVAAVKTEEKAAGGEKKEKTKGKVNGKVKKGKAAALSAHEVYLRSKAKGEERRRSYLPYRPELMGFFTNVNGGLTKNVHPF